MSSIFIQIPSYRDLELSKTIFSAFKNASQENNINFGISNVVLSEKEIYIPTNLPNFARLKSAISLAPMNIGVQQSRKIANDFYDGEDYYLQVDSHMRFEKNWDIYLISLIKRYQKANFKKPLLSTYPPGYYYDESLFEQFSPLDNVNVISFLEDKSKFEKTYIPSQLAISVNPECFYTASVSAAFIFTLGAFAKIIPNEKIAFWGEEILTAARAYTHGFDLLLPTRSCLWHLYYDHSKSVQENARYHVWKDFPEKWRQLEKETNQELNRIFINKVIGESELGSERTLEAYGEYAGLDFVNKKVVQCKWG